ncbi:MAG TPA: TIGR02757 family protein [Puia sp.]|uniref:TIGR02757 family protein n=1 Tax=Puia sp. TaxID=2045100 RepID=UPI002BC48D77|nr:TIGR02757 family protein [Puia sp.]HVU98787.1 TIGR02757 family protein [Puia sp.]
MKRSGKRAAAGTGKRATDGRGELQAFLDKKVAEYNRPAFVADDPIRVPHGYSRQQDIEIAAFFTAIFSWGNRTTIIRKSEELMRLMDQAPYEFVLHHTDKDLKRLLDFRHRTFNATDLLYFVAFFRHHYSHYDSLEDAFLRPWEERGSAREGWEAERSLSAFYHYFFSLDEALVDRPVGKAGLRQEPANDWPLAERGSAPLVPPRTRKHIASPEKNSSCKRINMFLRWMVRKDNNGVDFGLWRRVGQDRLICPLDMHVARVAKKFGLLTRPSSDWLAAIELTGHLREFDADDPTKYDFALFGLGALEKF